MPDIKYRLGYVGDEAEQNRLPAHEGPNPGRRKLVDLSDYKLPGYRRHQDSGRDVPEDQVLSISRASGQFRR
jgi:hypothetical protein